MNIGKNQKLPLPLQLRLSLLPGTTGALSPRLAAFTPFTCQAWSMGQGCAGGSLPLFGGGGGAHVFSVARVSPAKTRWEKNPGRHGVYP